MSEVTEREGKGGNYRLSFHIGPVGKGHLRKPQGDERNNWRIPRKTNQPVLVLRIRMPGRFEEHN